MKQTRHKRRRRYRKNRVAELRNKGMSYTEIADKLGVSESTVYRAKASNQNAVVFFSEGRGFSTKATKNMALKILRAGLSTESTAWLFGRSPHTIARWRRDESVKNSEKAVL